MSDRLDILHGFKYVPEYYPKFIPPTEKEIHQMKMDSIKESCIEFGLFLLGMFGYVLMLFSMFKFLMRF